MAPEDRVKQFAEALSTASSVRGRDAALRAARQVIIAQCLVAIGRDTHPGGAIAAVIREAAQTGDRQSRRVCALLIVHALGVPGLIPPSASADVCALAESGIRSVLHRCGTRGGDQDPQSLAGFGMAPAPPKLERGRTTGKMWSRSCARGCGRCVR